MSSIEQQLVWDIAAVTEGVVVTDSDLREARHDIEERIAIRRRRERRRTYAAVAAAAVLVAGGITAFLTLGDDDGKAQPAGHHTIIDPDADLLTGTAPTVQLIQGVWRLDNGDLMVQFGANGTVHLDGHGTLFGNPDTTGSYAIVGDRITVSVTQDGVKRCIGTQFAFRAALPQTGTMNFVPDQSAAGGCAFLPSGFRRGVWQQVLPTSQDFGSVTFPKDSQWKPLTDKFDLYGDLMPLGGGYLIQVEPTGTYFVADESGAIVDRGRSTLRQRTLTLTSGADSTCANGDQLVLGNMEYQSPDIHGVRGTVQRDTCQGGWGVGTWITITHYSID